MQTFEATIYGEPASKANSRQMIRRGGRIMFIKSKKALEYCDVFNGQCPVLDELIEGDVCVDITIYYKTRRPDLDESLILDLLQGKAYVNDRQVKEKRIRWGLDTERPRSIITITPLESGASASC